MGGAIESARPNEFRNRMSLSQLRLSLETLQFKDSQVIADLNFITL